MFSVLRVSHHWPSRHGTHVVSIIIGDVLGVFAVTRLKVRLFMCVHGTGARICSDAARRDRDRDRIPACT